MIHTIWQFDPANLTPYYNMALADSLASLGYQVHYLSSRFLYDLNMPLSGRFEVDYCYFGGLDAPILLKLPRLRRGLRAASYPLGHLKVWRKLQANPPQIFHVQWSRLPRLDYELFREVKKKGIPLVHTVHDVVPLFEARPDPYLARIYALADALILHSESNRATFLSMYPKLAPSKIHVIPHIALRNTRIPPDATQTLARERLGLPLGVPIWLFFGSLRPYKGVDILVKAFAQAVQQMPNLHLMIVGNPDSPRDLPDLSGLDAAQVYVKTGYIPYEDMWLYHLAADGIVCPYRHIYQSGALLMSMSFGRAIIATEVGSFPETIDGNGWLVPPENPEALAAALVEAAQQPQTVLKMGLRSRELLDTRYAEPTIADQHLKLYETLA